MIDLNTSQKEQVSVLYKHYKSDTLTRAEINALVSKKKLKNPSWLKTDKYKVDRGTYKLPLEGKATENEKLMETPVEATKTEAAYVVSSLVGDIVPKKDPIFVSFGNYPDVKQIVKSNKFYPVFITGLSGNGKTMGVTQACAELKKELIRVNITIETDEDDLLGGYRLKDGQTVWQNGPVIEAMERGALLLLDGLTWQVIRLCVYNRSLRVQVSLLKRLTNSLNQKMALMLSLLRIQKVKVPKTVSLLVLMF